MTERHNHWFLTAVAVTALMLAIPLGLSAPFTEDGQPKAANKTAAQGSTFTYLGTAADPLPTTTVLETFIKTSSPQDAIISVSLECSLVTDVFSSTVQDHPDGYTAVGEARARVVVWVEIDGVPVTIAGDDEDGRITFCDRLHRQEISDIDEDTGNFTIRQLQKTMSANAFNWFAFDLGSGVHHVAVKATIEAGNTEGSFAQGGIGKRTVVVEPTRFPTGASL